MINDYQRKKADSSHQKLTPSQTVRGYIKDKYKTVDNCSPLTRSLDRLSCFTSVAIHTGDYTICDNIDEVVINPELKEKRNSRNNCVVYIALSKSDENICLKTTTREHRDWCLHDIAVETNNKKICEMIPEDSVKDKAKHEPEYWRTLCEQKISI